MYKKQDIEKAAKELYEKECPPYEKEILSWQELLKLSNEGRSAADEILKEWKERAIVYLDTISKMTLGRPPKTLDDLPKKWQQIIIDLAVRGKSEVKMRVELGIGKTAWYNLKEKDETFRETIARVKDICQCYWEDLGHKNITNKEFVTKIWDINMQNRFGYSSKQKIDEDSIINQTVFIVPDKKIQSTSKKLEDGF